MAEKSNSRNYRVLRNVSVSTGEAAWTEVATLEASSAEQAIKLVATEKGAGRFVAIPDRSWSEMNVRVETPAPRIFVDDVKPETAKPGATQAEPKQPALA